MSFLNFPFLQPFPDMRKVGNRIVAHFRPSPHVSHKANGHRRHLSQVLNVLVHDRPEVEASGTYHDYGKREV